MSSELIKEEIKALLDGGSSYYQIWNRGDGNYSLSELYEVAKDRDEVASGTAQHNGFIPNILNRSGANFGLAFVHQQVGTAAELKTAGVNVGHITQSGYKAKEYGTPDAGDDFFVDG